MWSGYYWAGRYWGARFWPKVGAPPTPGYYWATRYWSANYWNPRYWQSNFDTSPFVATVTTGPATTISTLFSSVNVSITSGQIVTVTQGPQTTVSTAINASVQQFSDTEFTVAAPLLVSSTISTQIACQVSIGTAASSGTGYYWSGRYWAARYWAPVFWGTQSEFVSTVTQGLSSTITSTIAASVGEDLVFTVTSGLASSITANIGADSVIPQAIPQPTETLSGGFVEVPYRHRPRKKTEEIPPTRELVPKNPPDKFPGIERTERLAKAQARKALEDENRRKEEEDILLG